MQTLVLLRHAKAAAPSSGQADFDRSLTERGHADAARMGDVLKGLAPDLALVSTARRTRQTWEDVQARLAGPVTVSLEDELYLCRPSKLLARLRGLADEVGCVVAVGHNPCMQELALALADGSDGPALSAMRTKFPTAAAAIYTVATGTWRRLGPGEALLKRFVTPASL